jgi:ribonuclease P protein subunit POP4
MRTSKNIGKHELIGLNAEIVESKDPSLKGLKGVVVDETKNMLVIDVGGNEKKIIKKNVKLRFGNYGIVNGSKIAYRPEDRIKKVKSW